VRPAATRFASARREAYSSRVSFRRALQLLVLAALMLAPFGRIGMAEAQAMPQMMAAHCGDHPMPGPIRGHAMSVDCTIACAAMASPVAPGVTPPQAAAALLIAAPIPFLAGVRPEADPPPPRIS
jgi:hypothetical protein